MSTIKEKRGNILRLETGILVHGCNAQGVMRSGIAKDIRAMYPGAFEAYRRKYEQSGLLVGEVIFYEVPRTAEVPRLIIANAITQKYYGRNPNIRYVDYDGLERCFEAVARVAKETSLSVHFPLVGAGLANGEWKDIAPRIERALGQDIDRQLWLYTP